MKIAKILKESIEKWASDIILTSDSLPVFKINWDITYINTYEKYSADELKKELFSTMSEKQRQKINEDFELDYSIDLKGYSRFRVNVFFEKSGIWAVFRPIKTEIPKFDDLLLPKQLLKLSERKSGLLLVTWWVWSWKSTTMASLLGHINEEQSRHVITVEDPIEFVYENKKSLIEQREVWTTTKSFVNGLKYALRQASDVIMIWEMRDMETFRLALRAAETWNLVLATLHTSGAAKTISRIIDMFPWDEKDQVRAQLSWSLCGVIWQQLVKSKDKKSRVLATELLVNNTSISNMIRKWTVHQIDWAIETWVEDGMYTMEHNLEVLRKNDLID